MVIDNSAFRENKIDTQVHFYLVDDFKVDYYLKNKYHKIDDKTLLHH